MHNDSFTTVVQIHNWGYSVIPSGGGDSGKQPLVEWTAYQTGQPTNEQMSDWHDTLSPPLWGIVTNSTVAVIDADTPEARTELETELGKPHVITPRKGGHFYIDTTEHAMPTRTGILPGIDIRGEGGFVNIVGPDYEILTLPHPDTLIPYERIPERILSALNKRKPQIEPGQPILEGQRNTALARMAGAMRGQGFGQHEIETALLMVNGSRCQPPLQDAEVHKIATSIASYPSNSGNNKYLYTLPLSSEIATKPNKNLTENITEVAVSMEDMEAWIRQSRGWFSNDELDKELGYYSPKQKQTRLVYLKRLEERGIVQRHPTNNKLTRFITTDVRLIDFKRVGKRIPLDVGLPFDIHKLVNIYPGNIIVLAGAQNAGKTAFMLNVIRLNMYNFPIYYMSSEMGAEELSLRLDKFPSIELEDWNFTAWERVRDFADVIVPDAINIIDYYEFAGGEAFYQIAEGLRGIWEKLGSGIALVAVQKTRDKATGRGGDFGLEKPRLYLSMDAGKLKIVKGKNWAKRGRSPDRLVTEFKLLDGCNFVTTREWYHPEEA